MIRPHEISSILSNNNLLNQSTITVGEELILNTSTTRLLKKIYFIIPRKNFVEVILPATLPITFKIADSLPANVHAPTKLA